MALFFQVSCKSTDDESLEIHQPARPVHFNQSFHALPALFQPHFRSPRALQALNFHAVAAWWSEKP